MRKGRSSKRHLLGAHCSSLVLLSAADHLVSARLHSTLYALLLTCSPSSCRSGIGKHTAALLAQQGATVLVHGEKVRCRAARHAAVYDIGGGI